MTCTVLEYLFAASAAVFLALSAAGGWQSISLVTVLRLRHPVIWSLLGRPDARSKSDDVGNAAGLAKFLWRRDYVKLGDPEFSSMCERSRRCMLRSVLSLAVALVCLAATPAFERALFLQCWRHA